MSKTLKDMNKTSERIFKNGNSKAMSLSKQTIQLANFDVGDKVEVQEMNGGLFIKKKKNRLKIELQIFSRMVVNTLKLKLILAKV